MKKVKSSSFKLNPIAASIVLAIATQLTASVAYGNAGYGLHTDVANQNTAVPTFFANSPQGFQPALDPITHLPTNDPATGQPWASAADCFKAGPVVCPMVDTGAPLRKFVDSLTGAYYGLDGLSTAPYAKETSMGIPIGLTESWKDHGGQTADDYYEIAIVEYEEQMNSDLSKPTRLRGYVQVETANIRTKGLKDITGIIPSEHIQAKYLDGTPILDKNGQQVYFVHAPHYLGPTILAKKGTPVRILFQNYLPYTDVNGVLHGVVGSKDPNAPSGEMMIPVDTFIAGGGPTGVVDKNGKPVEYSQNRASIHWHGGDSPWTNDGTPHEFFAPYGDISYTYKDANHPHGLGVGESFHNVPDMPDPGEGSQTFFFPNNLSGRLMMYHDHASGITRLNAYIGEAAGYLVYDPIELTLAANALGTSLGATPKAGTPLAATLPTLPVGTLDAIGIPLVIQDKTFLPKNIGTNIVQSQDARWDTNHWGQSGDFFFPHVYETNQDPNSIDGTNPVGRWDWGPWFWPVFPSQYSLPSGSYGDVSTTPEAFMDTPIVNGQAYPTMTVDPKTYRFRILSIGNDRSFDLGLYVAVDANGKPCDSSNPTPAAYPVAPGQPLAAKLATCTELHMVPAAATSKDPVTGVVTNLPAGWPTDGRAGGVPDPANAGPDFVQIGNEGGLLPAPAIWPAQPVTYDQNVRSMTIFNILNHQLLLMPAERADVLVDFSKYAGKTLILYNDAPTPMPGLDPRTDFFTGNGDQTQSGGAYDTLPGYGPNTRTVMQIKVNGTNTSGTGGALNLPALQAALPVAYAASQNAPIVPESVYNKPFGTNYADNYARIFTGSNTQPAFSFMAPGYMIASGIGSAIVNTTGAGYTSRPTVTINGTLPMATQTVVDANGVTRITNVPGAATTATAIMSVEPAGTGYVTGIKITPGAGYLTKPTVTISGGGATIQAKASLTSYSTQIMNSVHVINKAIQELFDPVYGRMNATLAVELPFSSALVATTIPLAYVDAPIDDIDSIKDGETQIWKITHNGVDSHPVHFHLVNVQVINRVDWAGVVKPPAANEVGWRETLRMNPLEDVYVAVRASHPVTPFGVPRSTRTLDPSQAIGASTGLTQIDPLTGQTPTYQAYITNPGPDTNVNNPSAPLVNGLYTNQLTDFDNEYVWHCHILGHEEFDFMRPFVFHPDVVTPDAPGKVTLNANGTTLTWTDPTPVGGEDAQGIPTAGTNAAYPAPTSSPKNEIGFKVERNAVLSTTTTTPQVTSFYAVNTVTMTNGGSGYGNTVPTVTFSAAPAGGTRATGTAVMGRGGAAGTVVGINVTNVGAGYTATPTITISAPGGRGNATARATATTTLTGTAWATTTTFKVLSVSVGNGGLRYTGTPAVTFSNAPAGGTTATGTATVVNGIVTGITVTNPGAGYTSAPTVTISTRNTGGTTVCNTGGANNTRCTPASGLTVKTSQVTKPLVTTSTVTKNVAVAVAKVPANTTSLTDSNLLQITVPPSSATKAAFDAVVATLPPLPAVVNTLTVSDGTSQDVTATYSYALDTSSSRKNPVVVAYNAAMDPNGVYVGDSAQGTLNTATSGALNGDGTTAAAGFAVSTKTAIQLANAAATSAVTAPAAPTGLTQALSGTAAAPTVTLSWNAVDGATSYLVTYGDISKPTIVTVLPVAPATVPPTTLVIPAASNSNVTVVAVGPTGLLSTTSQALYSGVALPPVAFNAVTGANTGEVSLTWANDPKNVNNVTGFALSWTGATSGTATFPSATSKGATVTGLTSGGAYTFSLIANGSAGNSSAVSSLSVNAK